MMAASDDEFILSRSPSHLLHRAQQLAAETFSRNTEENGVTLRQFAVLAAVAEQPGRSQTDLVRVTGVDRSTLADMISRMEKRGWVTRKTAASDARAKAVNLTASGRKTLAAATPIAAKADQALLDAVPRARRDAFVRTLEQLAQAVDASEAAAPPPPAAPAKPKAKVKKPVKETKPAKPAKPAKADKPVAAAAPQDKKKKPAKPKGKTKKARK